VASVLCPVDARRDSAVPWMTVSSVDLRYTLSQRTLKLLFVSLALLATFSLSAADLLRVLPVTDEVIMLHFREGHIDCNGVRPDGTFEPQTENRVDSGQLIEPSVFGDAAGYRITSSNDPAFGDGRSPVTVGYKAEGTEFNSPFRRPPFLRDFWVYAVMPAPLRSGKTYSVQVGDLAENLNQYTFTFDEKRVRSPTIHVSQVGFSPDAPKFAYFSQWLGFSDQSHFNRRFRKTFGRTPSQHRVGPSHGRR